MAKSHVYHQFDRVLLAVDCIIFGFDGKKLKALFARRNFPPEKGKWSLLGGFVGAREDVRAAATRVLKEFTGMEDIYMEQLYCFGDIRRDRGGRVVAIAYSALINIQDYPKDLMEKHRAKWFSMRSIPSLVFDHREMVQMARKHLREKAVAHPLGFELLPEKFTMAQLQSLYEAIFETEFDTRNFVKKILGLNILRRLDEKETTSSRKGSFYYVFDKHQFNKKMKEGLQFI
jgi:8-oxo-dGTP diphosphatase